ncbi:MAG: hypothetical protein AAFO82_14475 [Bacteroidota bacterium]
MSKYRLIIILILRYSTVFVGQDSGQICLNRNASFLYQSCSNLVSEPLSINLKEWNIKVGDTLQLKSNDSWNSLTQLIGVFSKDSLILSDHYLHRIPGAIDYGKEIFTSKSLCDNEMTDIEEDFYIENRRIIVPKHARYLFLGHDIPISFNQFKDSICFSIKSSKFSNQFDIKTIAKLKVGKCRTKLFLWDDSNEDGDIVTLYLNGKKIVDRYEVVNKRRKIQLILQSGRNEFWIYAENAGKLGDNTAVLQIEGKPYRKVIHINSKAGTAKNIVIICNEN